MRPYLVGNFFVKQISFWETRVIKGVTVIKTNGKSFFNIFNPQDFNELPNAIDYSMEKLHLSKKSLNKKYISENDTTNLLKKIFKDLKKCSAIINATANKGQRP